jgi:dihydroorotase
VFDEEEALDRFEAFASLNGPAFYGLPVSEGTVTLERAGTEVPERIGDLVPFGAAGSFGWRLAG